jgi:ABC-type multidrug transport system ATPase subunit
VRLFGEVNSNISHEFISKRVLLLMGMTKAGKTTLLYYLLGKRLLLEKNELDVYQMRP